MTKAEIYKAATQLDRKLWKLEDALREVRQAADMDSLATAQAAESTWKRAQELLMSICAETLKTDKHGALV